MQCKMYRRTSSWTWGRMPFFLVFEHDDNWQSLAEMKPNKSMILFFPILRCLWPADWTEVERGMWQMVCVLIWERGGVGGVLVDHTHKDIQITKVWFGKFIWEWRLYLFLHLISSNFISVCDQKYVKLAELGLWAIFNFKSGKVLRTESLKTGASQHSAFQEEK